MTKVYMKYNPYTVESEIKIDGVEVKAPNKLADLKNERLQVWVEDLLPLLEEMTNDDVYEIEFYGTQLDYSDLELSVKEYADLHKDIQVQLKYTYTGDTENKVKELNELFQYMQKTCPFADLKTEQIKENFENAMGSEFEVSVIATMSSGKSTLINALLGRELMPSKNEACTATIAKIKDVDGMKNFSAEYYDVDDVRIDGFQNLTLENMIEMNDNPRTATIQISGDIPNINSSEVKLVLVDTPGPNNSRTEEHKNHTYRIIKEKSKPMVLYVLNATQLQTNDDKELLSAVAEAMKTGGKQSKDRFLFAVNKIDTFDPDREDIGDAIESVKEYLEKFDIENPNVFPISAEMAKVIRLNENNQPLTAGQKRTLRNFDLFIDEEQFHLSEKSSLSKVNKIRVKEELQKARDLGDDYKEALIHTGVPAIEYAIDEYLKKYAYTIKIKTAVDTFKKKVEEKDMHAKMMQSIQNDENARIRINNQLIQIEKQLEEGNAAEEFKNKIKELDMTAETSERIAKLRKKITSLLVNKNSAQTMTTLQAQQLMMKLDRTIRNLQSDVKTELENIINDVIVENAQQVISEYREHMRELISSGGLDAGDYTANANLKFLEEDIPDAQDIINNYKYDERYDTGETEWVKNQNKKWYKPWTWFQESGHYRTIYANREMVDYSTVYNDFVQPVIVNFGENISNAKNVANEEAEKFRKYFLGEIDKLEEKLKEKVKENEKLTKDHKNIVERLEKEKANMEWLNDFMERLERILTI